MNLIINGETVEQQKINEEMDRLRPQYEQTFKDMAEEEREQQLFDWSKENVIERTLLSQVARQDNYSVEPAEIDKAFSELKEQQKDNPQFDEDEKLIRGDIELHLRMQNLIGDITKDLNEIDDDQALSFFREEKSQFMVPEQVRAAHIVKYINPAQPKIDAYQKISEIQQKLKDGTPFEALADQDSDCPGNGGDLGYFGRGQMVQEFEDVVFQLKINQVSDLILSEYGYHIAKLYDHQQPRPMAFDQVKDHIKKHLKDQASEKIVEKYVDELKTKATIEEKK